MIGSLLAWAAVQGKLPGWIRPTLMTFSGVASNFAGVPLAFAFICTLGRVGLVTVLLKKYLGFNLYSTGFSILSFSGLTLTYLYFQIPLMVLIVTPALDGLKREWREACDCLGGTAYQYWRYVALPVLWPSVLGAALLLFANSFGAVATAYALTGSSLNIVHDPAVRADSRRRDAQPESRLCARARHGARHRPFEWRLHLAALAR